MGTGHFLEVRAWNIIKRWGQATDFSQVNVNYFPIIGYGVEMGSSPVFNHEILLMIHAFRYAKVISDSRALVPSIRYSLEKYPKYIKMIL